MELMTITKENFKEKVLEASQPVLVDFWADWCGPCKMLSPIVDQIAQENDSFLVGKINVDEQQELAMEYKVSSIPTLIVFEKGEVKARTMGVQSKANILQMLA